MQITGAVVSEAGDGLAGVAVCDGHSWAFSGPGGSFSLDCTGCSVWVRRPPGWECAQWWQHAGPGRHAVFRMRPSAAGRRPSLRLAHITDTHVSTLHGDPGQAAELATRYGDRTDCLAGLGRVLSSAASRGAALAVITGDLTDHGTREEFQRVLGALRDAPLPVEIVPGNHDHYGHRHEPRRDDSPLGDGFLGSATITRYEQALGPRWWSADIGGVHFLGLDWFSAWCGIDRAEQQRFAAADLATRARGLPVIVLSHDQPDEETLALIQEHAGPGGLLAVLSGHWHASAQRTAGGCRFLSTPAASLGGLDWSAPQFRMLTIEGAALTASSLEHAQEPAPGTCPPQLAGDRAATVFEWPTGSRQHLGNLITIGRAVVVPTTGPDGHGHLTRVHPGGGATWTTEAAAESVTGIAACNGRITASSEAGAIITLEATSGQCLWTRQLPGRGRRRLLAAPLITPGGHIVAGDLGGVACLDADTGDLRWQTACLAQIDTLLTYGTAAATSDLAIMPFGGPTRGLTALRLTDGTIAWSEPSGTPPPSSSLVPLGDGDALLVRTLGPTIERFELATGHLRWRTTLQGRYSTAAPIAASESVLLVTGDGLLHHLDPATGAVLHRQQLTGLRDAYGPYRSTGTGAPTSPLDTPTGPVIVLLDGSVWHLGAPGDIPELIGEVPGHVTTQPVLADDHTVAILTTDATLHTISLPGAQPATGDLDLASWSPP